MVNFILLGAFFGCFFVLIGFSATLSHVIKIPGGNGSTYWALGALLATVSNFTLSMVLDHIHIVTFALTLGSSYLALMLVYWGVCISEMKASKRSLFIAGGVYLVFCCLLFLYMPSPVVTVFCRSSVQAAMWIIILREILLTGKDKSRNKIAIQIAALGTLFLLVSSGLRFYDAYVNVFLAGQTISNTRHQLMYIGSFFGWIIFLFGQMLIQMEKMEIQTHLNAMHDALTGLQNRRAIIQSAEREIALTKRNGQPLAIAFIDIDYFKNINDQYGHDQGDQALCAMANILRRTSRRVDLIGRYGGEEFCVIYPGVDHAGAKMAGERLLAAVRAYPFEGLPRFTISIGLAMVPVGESAITWDQLVNLADIELYKAKQAGRDRYAILAQAVIPEQAAASATSAMA